MFKIFGHVILSERDHNYLQTSVDKLWKEFHQMDLQSRKNSMMLTDLSGTDSKVDALYTALGLRFEVIRAKPKAVALRDTEAGATVIVAGPATNDRLVPGG